MDIRKAQGKDFALIGALVVSNWQSTYKGLLDQTFLDNLDADRMAKQWSEYAAMDNHTVLAVYQDNTFAGFVASMPEAEISDCLYLDSLHVAPRFRGRGIGTTLINAVLQFAKGQGYSACTICIVRGNDKAGNLYHKLGAQHYKYFTDDFHGVPSQSEKLIWKF